MSKEGSSDEGAREGGGAEAAKKDPNADLYESKGSKKIVRLITVVAYMFSVSFVAIVLSAYYLFLWEPPNPRLMKRPNPLSGEPEVQFLVDDPPGVMSNHQVDQLLAGIEKNPSGVKFASRMLDDASDASNQLDREEKLNESLLLIRQSMIEYQRKVKKESGYDQFRYDSTESVSRGQSNLTKESNEGSTTSVINVESETLNISEQGRPDDVYRGLNFSIDSAGEGNRSFTNDTEDPIESSDASNSGIEESQGGEYIPTSFQRRETFVETSGNGSKTETTIAGNVAEPLRDSRSNAHGGEFPGTTEITALINKSAVVMTARDKEDPDVRGARDNARADGLVVSNRSPINSSRDSKLADRLELNPSFQAFANVAMNFKETQIEKITTRPVTNGKEQVGGLATTTVIKTESPRQNLLTVLTKTTTMSSSVMTLSSSDSPVNPSTESTQERVTNASTNSD
nr:uncharacterized protein LOC116423967 [Nomia melanderi]